ncbi:hypothetical protein AMECASPLE_010055 [Ameca splendens]|uniref:Uncharacterized protein n=1 Tax=Ameca splendens TaxID=208324 RepID=A0ABV0ZBJ3_9TELE
MRGSCLTQNGAWFKSQKERGNHRVRLRELYRSQRTHLSSLSLGLGFFSNLFLLPLLFSLQGHSCPFFLRISSVPPAPRFHLPPFTLLWLILDTNNHRRQARIQGCSNQQDSRRDSARRGFNESEASSAGGVGGVWWGFEIYANDMHTPKRDQGCRRGRRWPSSR